MKLKFNRDGWTDWIQHDHKGCPVVGWYILGETNRPISRFPKYYVYSCDNMRFEGVCRQKPSSKNWTGNSGTFVVRYKVRKPLGASKLEEILKDLPKEPKSKQLEST